MNKRYYNTNDFQYDLQELAVHIPLDRYSGIYGVPQGGAVLAMALSDRLRLPLLDKPNTDALIVDDIIDTGKTRSNFPLNDFACLHIKKHSQFNVGANKTFSVHKDVTDWIVYWWEGTQEKSILPTFERQLEYIGENPNREGLVGTPERILKSWDKLFFGYKIETKDIITVFDNEGYDEMVLLKDIEFYSMCEHHFLPFFGKAHVAYIPDKKVIGISKLARLIDVYARRLQIQERICEQVTRDLMKYLEPKKGSACIIEAQHLCMLMRGVQKQNSVMVTSSLKGAFYDKQEAREELMGLIK